MFPQPKGQPFASTIFYITAFLIKHEQLRFKTLRFFQFAFIKCLQPLYWSWLFPNFDDNYTELVVTSYPIDPELTIYNLFLKYCFALSE